MAGKKSGPPLAPATGSIPVVGLLLGAAGLLILAVSAVIIVVSIVGQQNSPVPPVVENPSPGPKPPADPPQFADAAWWDNLPTSKLAGTVAQLKKILPQDKSMFDSLGAKADIVRLDGYQDLMAKLPELLRNPQAKPLLERLLIDGYASEPANRNVTPLREWFVQQIPKENAVYPAGYQSEDLDRSLWALDIGMQVLAHKLIEPERRRYLSEELGKALGFAIDPSASPQELKTRAEKLLALRCYANLAPTAVKSVDLALTIRETLAKKFSQQLSVKSRERMDIEVAFGGLPGAKKSWPAYSTLLRDCLNSKDPAIEVEVVALYAQADAELAAKIEPLLAGKWNNIIKDVALDRDGKTKAILRALGVPDPADRLTLLENLARETLTSATSSAKKSHAVLQETARLSHASTLACALLQKAKGHGRFDELFGQVPEIEPDDEPAPVVKEGDPKLPGIDPKLPGMNPGVPLKAGQRIIHDKLPPGTASKAHSVVLKRGKTYTIDLVSAFDNYLRLESSKGVRLAEDDDSGGGLNARIVHAPTFDDTYKIVATSPDGRGTGDYALTIQELPGFGGPGFGPPGFGPMFPPRFGPMFPGGRPFPRPIGMFPPGPMFFPPQPPVIIPGQPKVNPKQDPKVVAVPPLVDEVDLTNLGVNVAKTRMAALRNITSKLTGDLSEKDLTIRQAAKIGKYLATLLDKNEADEAVANLAPLAKSRNLMLAIADNIDHDKANQKISEAVVGTLLGQPLTLGKDDNWRGTCRKLLLMQALEFTGKKKSGPAETAEIMRDQYKEQGLLLDMEAKAFAEMTRPAQVLEALITHLAARLGKQDPAKADKEYLDQVPRQLAAAQFVAQNDLEHTVLLQRVWIKVLALHLEQQIPQRAAEIRQVQLDLTERERLSANVLDQLRGGEEKLLRLWSAALDLK